jgi:hypothetical protein
MNTREYQVRSYVRGQTDCKEENQSEIVERVDRHEINHIGLRIIRCVAQTVRISISIIYMVGAEGFEPPTLCSQI